MNTTEEGKVKIYYHEGKISRGLEVFYNPVMKTNRDITIDILNTLAHSLMNIALPLAGSGVRGLRLIQELNENKIQTIKFNDHSKDAVKLIEKNFKLNNLPLRKLQKKGLVEIYNQDANDFLMNTKGFDYVDIDPFGSPVSFLDNAIRKLSRSGILAVTATDTSALAGTYPKACMRKYWAVPKKDGLMHETGLRILIRRAQLVGASMEKALIPIYSYSKDHYMRVFFHCEKSKKKCDEVLKKHGMFQDAGPMWLGELWNKNLAKEVNDKSPFLNLISGESQIPTVGFYDVYDICSKNKLSIPKFDVLMDKIRKKNHEVSRTHFSPKGIRSTISEKELILLLKRK